MKQAALTLAVRLVGLIAGLVSSIATARYLGPEGRGVFFFWSTVAALIVQFGNFGLHASNIYLHAKRGVDIGTLAANSLVIAFGAGIVLTVAVATSLFVGGRELALDPLLLAALVLLSVSGLATLLGGNLLVAMDRLTEFNLLEFFSRVLLLGVLLVVLIVHRDPVSLLLTIGIASAVAAGALLWRVLQRANRRPPNMAVFRSGLAYGMRAYLAACLATLVARTNALMLEPAVSAADYGAWSIASQLCDMMLLVPQSIALVLLPRVMRSDSPHVMVRASALMAVSIMAVILLAFLLVGQPLIVMLYGAAYEPAFGYVLWAAPGILALTMISILSQYIASIGIPALLIGLWLAVAALHATLVIWFVTHLGVSGGMASQSLAYLVALLLMFVLIRHQKGRQQ